MSYCLGSTKAKINISISEKLIETIKFDKPPINVNLQHGQTAQVQGAGLDLNNCGQFNNYQIIEYSGFVVLVSTSVATPSSNSAGFCSGLKPSVNGVLTPGTNDVYHPSATIVRQYSSDWILTVVDSLGRIIVKKYSTEPTYTVACGDECPEGFCKCIIPEYPGYCCLDCNSAAASIRSITNSLRGR